MKQIVMGLTLGSMLGLFVASQYSLAHDGDHKSEKKTPEAKVVDSAKERTTKEKADEKTAGMPMKGDMKVKMTDKMHEKMGDKADHSKSPNSPHGHSDQSHKH